MFNSWQEAALFNTSLISAKNTKTNESWIGTGFYVALVTQDGIALFLVSNKHVLENTVDVEYSVSLHKKTSKNNGMLLRAGKNEIYVDLLNSEKIKLDWHSAYFQHPDGDVDLACICCSELLEREDLVLVPFSQEKILNWDASFLHPGQQAYFIGYPDGVSDSKHNLPIMRGGILSSLPYLNFDGQPDFLLDAQVWPGSSGSPVFVKGEEGQPAFSLIGIIHSTRTKFDQTDTNIGLGYAVKSSELLVLFQHIISPKEN